MRRAIKAWKDTLGILQKHPKVLVPFVIAGIANGLALYLLFLAPQRPVSYVLAPPVRAFFGERFLHYPFHLFLLPKLLYYAQILVSASVGILMTGVAIGMLKDVKAGLRCGLFRNLFISLKRYFGLLGIWMVIFLITFPLTRVYKVVDLNESLLGLVSYVIYLVAIFIQFIFIYAMPALIIEKRNILSSIKRGLWFLKRFFFPTLLLVMVPVLLYLPVMLLKQNLGQLVNKFFPEIIVIVLGAGIFITLIIDILTTACPTVIFLKEKK